MAEPESSKYPPASKREIWSWAMFDFANSSYTTVIVTVAFSVYFTRMVAPEGRGDFLWGLGIAISNLIVLSLSPIVGAIADDSGRKKLFLLVTWLTCVIGTALLWFVQPGQVGLGLTLLVISFLGFSFGENLAGAFLPEISTPANIGRISGLGWGLGYFGGLGCLLLIRPLLAGDFVESNLPNLRLAWLVTAGFFLLAALPTFLFLKERAPRANRTAAEYVRAGFTRLAATAGSVRRFSEVVRFLTVYFFYYAGLSSVVAFAGIYASRTLGFTSDELMLLFLLLQISSAIGAFVFGWVQDRLGAVRTVQITLVLWVLVCIGAYACGEGSEVVVGSWTGKQLFWPVGLFAGFGIGSLQSASRALVGLFAPPEKAAEFYGFWGLSGKAAYMIGPLIFGAIASTAGSQRIAMLSTAAFFLLGLIGMAFVDEKRGRAAAAAWSEPSPPRPSSP
ncbi:MAG TPA: MFS transporter, partial [Thermoanaerobaculia bacterium]|nr:MFS transporter [Thermoanaerobaculia bacterium]